jgi:hypothetical protein
MYACRKTVSLKSLFIRLDASPHIDFQFVEISSVDGKIIQTVQLPDTRLDLATLSADDRAKLAVALGALNQAHHVISQQAEALARVESVQSTEELLAVPLPVVETGESLLPAG